MIKLVVTRPFGRFAKGDVVEDAEEVAAILAGESAASVVRVQTDDVRNVGSN